MKEFNSKTFLMCLTVFLMTNSVVARRDLFYQEILDDLPTITDFDFYLSVLEKAVDFCVQFQSQIDMNLQFGLFMVELNLRLYKEKEMPKSMLSRLKELLEKTEGLKASIELSLQDKEMDELEKTMTNLFHNASKWLSPEQFHTKLLNVTVIYTKEQLETMFDKFERYYFIVFDFQRYKPTPDESDECLIQLLKKGRSVQRSWPNCVASAHCRDLLKGGSEYGYGLTHRMLFMFIARYYRKCVVFGEEDDEKRMNLYCTKAYNEAQFIAKNYFELLDLMAEQIALCSYMGHSQFLRNYWLRTMAEFQTEDGCFLQTLQVDNHTLSDTFYSENSEENLEAQCQLHFTAVAVAVFSSVVRYIIETGRFF